jgi:hypothetical protein
MKKIMLCMAGSLLFGVSVAQAQDSTRTNTRQQQPQTYPQPTTPQTTIPTTTPPQSTQPTTTQPPAQQPQTLPSQSQYRPNDMVTIPQNQLPESLRATLRGNEYKGWEQSKIYQNPSTGEYLLEMETTTNTPTNTNPNATIQDQSGNNSLRTYRFDRYGRVINDQNKTGNKDN